MKPFLPLIATSIAVLLLGGGYFFMLTQVDASVLRIESAIASAEALTKKDVGLQTSEVFLKETTELR